MNYSYDELIVDFAPSRATRLHAGYPLTHMGRGGGLLLVSPATVAGASPAREYWSTAPRTDGFLEHAP